MLPGGVFIPIASEIVYRKMPADFQRVESNTAHCTVSMKLDGLQPIELIRSNKKSTTL